MSKESEDIMSFNKNDLKALYRHALNKHFIMETGGGGPSTVFLSRAANLNNAIMVTIEEKKERLYSKLLRVDYQIGWSVSYEDLIKKGDRLFRDIPSRHRRKSYKWSDRKVVCKGKEHMTGETDLIRKSVRKYGKLVDFFFCDTGEYCGLAEWNVVKNLIAMEGVFACHDIYYPRSIKCFQVVKAIKKSEKWKILVKTKSKQGLLIAAKCG